MEKTVDNKYRFQLNQYSVYIQGDHIRITHGLSGIVLNSETIRVLAGFLNAREQYNEG